MQGPSGDLLGGGTDLAPEPRRNFVGGLVGKSDGADPCRRQPFAGDEVTDARDQAVGLAGARTGDDEHGSEGGLNRTALGIGRGQGQSDALHVGMILR